MFYRVHWDDCPDFTAENAQSLTWSARADAESDCPRCGGEGEVYSERKGDFVQCCECVGTGAIEEEAVAGYSCCESAEGLVKYFSSRGAPADSQRVVIFSGEEVGRGYDSEALVIPKSQYPHPRWTTWGAIKQ